jgi:DNA mismatch endonuclease, patch repair protein
MSRVKARGTRSTEWKFRSLLMRSGVRGWQIGHDSGLPGSPDLVFRGVKLAVFVDGCFWHGCRRCRSVPATNVDFWSAKISGNMRRDRRVASALRAMGWNVLRVWEHELRGNPRIILRRVAARRVKVPSLTNR